MRKPSSNIASPDELNKHLQSTSPVTWSVLVAIVALLGTFFGWSILAKLPAKIAGVATLSQGEASLRVATQDKPKLAVGQKVVISGIEGSIWTLDGDMPMAKSFDLSDGEYPCYVVREVRPIVFLWGDGM